MTMLLTQTNNITAKNAISQYISYVNSIPLLTESEEKTLLHDFVINGNQNSGKKVAEAHLRVVVKIAMEFRAYCQNLWDMIAEGNIGLLKALKNFSLEKDVRFVTYAMLWVRASIQEFVLRTSSMLKINIGQMQKKILFNLSKVKSAINKYSNKECTTKEIANILQVPESEIIDIANAVSSAEVSLNTNTNEDSDSTIQDITPAEINSPEQDFLSTQTQNENKKAITTAFKGLNERERIIITKRFLAKKQSTLLDLSKDFGISVERVRQIEAAALQKMKKLL
jgi:RNA polymerase sigma-32 factor